MKRRRVVIHVSDHAVLRYLERCCGLDVDAIRAAIGTGCARGAEAGAPVVRFGGARFLIRNNTVVTVLEGHRIVSHQNLTRLMHGDRDD